MEMIRNMRGRLVSEGGSVGVVVALVLFLVMGMLTMTWNTAQLSKTKMRLQNAADSAALAHAVWQARGMNVVQNINDEMYEGLGLAVKLRKAAKYIEIAAQALDVAGKIPGPWGLIARTMAAVLHTAGVLFGGTGGWIAKWICKIFLKNIEFLYAKSAAFLGYWNALQLAGQNEADPVVMADLSRISQKLKDWKLGIYAAGFALPIKDTIFLPLAESGKDEVKKAPWKVDKMDIFDTAPPPWKQIYSITGVGEAWEIKPYVSKRGDQEGLKKDGDKVTDGGVLPGPSMWIAFKLGGNILTLPLDGFFNEEFAKTWTHSLPVFAVAAAQCITGDVVIHSKKTEENKTNQRPAGFGAGATAKLVPVSEVPYVKSKTLGHVFDAIIYH